MNILNNGKKKFDGSTLLDNRLDLNTVPQPLAIQYYCQIFIKLEEILNDIYSKYLQDGYTFIPVDDRLVDLYNQLHHIYTWYDTLPQIQQLKITNVTGFRLEGDFRHFIKIWSYINYKEDIEEIKKKINFKYPVPADLKLAFIEIDELLIEYKKIKNKILKSNTYSNEQLLDFGKEDSYIKSIFNILVEAHGELVRVNKISKELNKSDSYVRIQMGELRKKIKKQHKDNDLKVESSRKGSYRLTVS